MSPPDAISGAARVGTPAGTDPAVAVARHREDVVVGDEIVRHSLASRAIHWTTAFFFFASLLTGMPIWSPIFGWMAGIFGGLAVCRWLHPLLGAAFFVTSFAMFLYWMREMVLEPAERGWLGPKALRYLTNREMDPDVGKYNGGQKIFFWGVSLGALLLVLSGIVMWFPEFFPDGLRVAAILLHVVAFIVFTMAIVGHIYLGTAAEPGTFHSMTRGTVTKAWARLHHPRWYREVTRGDSERD